MTSETMFFIGLAVLGAFVLGWLACEIYALWKRSSRRRKLWKE